MNLTKEIGILLRKEMTIEWRQKHALGGILLYVISTVFVVYTAIKGVQPNVWNALFWIVILFASVNALVKSFVQENSSRQLYYYTIANPTAIILSKIIYNSGLLFLLTLLSYGAFILFAGNPVKDVGQFFLAMFLGSVGFSISFTFIAAISAKANNSSTLMAILSFPIVIPIILTLLKLSSNALRLMQDSSISKDIMTLVAIDVLMIATAFILFPFLWRD